MQKKDFTEKIEEAINATLNFLELYDINSASDLRNLKAFDVPMGYNGGYIKIDQPQTGAISTTRISYYYNGNKDPILSIWIEKPYMVIRDNGKIIYEKFLRSRNIHDLKDTLENLLDIQNRK